MYKVFIGGPVRNRGWVFQEHLDSLFKQQGIIPKYCYVLNNSTDDTEMILKKNGINYVVHDIEHPRKQWTRGHYSFEDLATVRNVFLEEFLKSDCEYAFSIDSDIILDSPTTIIDLIMSGKAIISALIKNSDVIYAHNILIKGRQPKNLRSGILEVDTTGAVYIIRRDVIEAGVRYGLNETYGEDYVFCEEAQKAGYKLYCDTSIQATHVFAPGKYLLPEVQK
jgi:signal recognition particle subunit SEC65